MSITIPRATQRLQKNKFLKQQPLLGSPFKSHWGPVLGIQCLAPRGGKQDLGDGAKEREPRQGLGGGGLDKSAECQRPLQKPAVLTSTDEQGTGSQAEQRDGAGPVERAGTTHRAGLW